MTSSARICICSRARLLGMPGQWTEATRWLTPKRCLRAISRSAISAGGTDQEAVLEQLVEAVVEIIARRHDLVLAPFAVGLVFDFERGARQADRLVAGSRDKHLASHRQLGRERLAVLVERAPVEIHLPRQSRQGAVRVDVPAIAEPRRPSDRDIGIGADPDRRHRLLQWLDGAVGVIEGEMRARHVDKILGPQPLDGEQTLLEARSGIAPRQPERLELDIAVADAAAKNQLAAAHDVEGGELFGDVERLVQRQQHQPADQPQARRQYRRLGQKRDLLQGLQRVGAVMRALDQCIEAELFGAHDEVDVVCEPGAHILARGMLATDDQADFHSHSFLMPRFGGPPPCAPCPDSAP